MVNPAMLTGAGCIVFSICPFVRPSVRPTLPKLGTRYCENECTNVDATWHTYATCTEQEHKMVTFMDSRSKSRSHEAEDRFGGLAEASDSFYTRVDQVSFLDSLVDVCATHYATDHHVDCLAPRRA